MNKAAEAYFKTKVSTTDQGQLLLMLYDGALNYLQQARDKMLAKDYAAKGVLISKVIDIVNELSSSLNMDKGGSLAENLNNLYFLCTARLLQANLKMNVDQLDSVVSILTGLRNAYAQILNTPEAQRAAQQIASQLKPEASLMQRAAVASTPMTAMPANIGQRQARAAYGQHVGTVPPAPAAQQPMSAPVAPAAPKMPQTPQGVQTAPRVATVTHMPHPPVTQASPAVCAAVNGDTVPQPATPPKAAAPLAGMGGGFAASAQMYQKLTNYKKM